MRMRNKNDHAIKTNTRTSNGVQSDFRGGKSRIVTNTYYVKVLVVKRHIACPNRTDLCENYGP